MTDKSKEQDTDTQTVKNEENESANESTDKNSDSSSTDKNKGEKTFTQAEVDKIVQTRVSKYKDYDEIKTQASEYEKAKTKYDKIENENKEIKTAISETLNALLEQIPNDKLSLIPDDFSDSGKIKYINKNRSQLLGAKTTPVNIPEKDTHQREEQGKILGKYDSLQEAADNDPRGYLKLMNDMKAKDNKPLV
jgi:hypothetical protein